MIRQDILYAIPAISVPDTKCITSHGHGEILAWSRTRTERLLFVLRKTFRIAGGFSYSTSGLWEIGRSSASCICSRVVTQPPLKIVWRSSSYFKSPHGFLYVVIIPGSQINLVQYGKPSSKENLYPAFLPGLDHDSCSFVGPKQSMCYNAILHVRVICPWNWQKDSRTKNCPRIGCHLKHLGILATTRKINASKASFLRTSSANYFRVLVRTVSWSEKKNLE